MTSRGNQSVSPPDQIPQQRHVNAISSSTPPPQPYYQGQSSALSQGAYEFLPQAQGQPFNPYQAYGSALSDTRGQPGSTARAVPAQQSIPQGAGFFQQPGPNIRPQQAQQGHTYFISAHPQSNIRHPRPSHQPPSQPVMYLPQSFTPSNNVITIPAYPGGRVPVFPHNPPYLPTASYPNIVYYQNGAQSWRSPGIAPTASATVRPQVREKKVLSIMDPDTGRDITEELFHSRSHSASTEEQLEETTQVDQSHKEICQTFTRLVADRLKSPDDSTTSGVSADAHGTVGSAPLAASGNVLPSQQYQQPPPQTTQQQQPSAVVSATVMRPPPAGPNVSRSGLTQQPLTPPAAPAHDIQHQVLNVNLSMPPPQIPLRQPSQAVFNTVPQQHAPRLPHQPQQQQPVRLQMNSVNPPPSQQSQPPHSANVHPSSVTTDSVPQPAVEQIVADKQKPLVEATSHNIPSKPVGPVTPTQAPPQRVSPVKEVSFAPQHTAEVGDTKSSNVPPSTTSIAADSEVIGVSDKAEDSGKVDVSFGVSQAAKDGRKGKKGKKDFNRKEIGGSDMDAFIDKTKSDPSKPIAGSDDANSVSDRNEREPKVITESPSVTNLLKRDPKNPWNIRAPEIPTAKKDAPNPWMLRKPEVVAHLPKVDGAISDTPKVNNAMVAATNTNSSGASALQESEAQSDLTAKEEAVKKTTPAAGVNVHKHPVAQSSGLANDTGSSKDVGADRQKSVAQQKQPTVLAQGQNEASETDKKHYPPHPVAEKKSSIDKPVVQDIETQPASTPAVEETAEVTKTPLPQHVTPVSTTPSEVKSEDKAVTQQGSKAAAENASATETVASAKSDVSSKNQTQQQTEQTGSNLRNTRRSSGQTERQNSKPFENGIPDDTRVELSPDVPANVSGESSSNLIPQTDEGITLRDSAPKQKSVEILKEQSLGIGEPITSRHSAEKSSLVVKKDSKEKLHYDRAYLMELRESISSQTKPEGLPDLEIILDRPVVAHASRGTSTAPDFTPAFFQPTGNQRHAPQIGKTNSRNRPRSDVQIPQRIIKSVSLQDSVKPLHQSEKPWKPAQKVSSGEGAEKRKSLESEVLFIMNRLTPTNFERLAVEMKKLNIRTYEDLQELVKIFFDKVTMETKFVEAYALLCKVMSGLRVQPPANSGIKDTQATFRVVMLTKCQQEFEADKTVVFEDPEEKKKKIESEMPEGPERLAQIENTLYQMKLKRLKFYGNIRFIGELFKLNMLTENIMHDCIYRLLKARDDDSLVSLCNLITTVGQALDTDKAKTRMDQYFAQMAKIAEERKSRIKFTLKDAIDLRSNNWVPRKEHTGPKKIDEVHKDYQEEQATKQFLQSQPLPPRNDPPQSNSRRGSRQRQDEKQPTDDGWNTVGSKSLRIDASKMKLSKNVVDENSIQLGPGGGMKQFSMWSRGSYGGAQPSQDERSSQPSNRFSALRGEEDRRNYQMSPSRGDSRSMRQGPTAGHGRGKILARSSQEGDRRDAIASARSIVGGRSQNSSRDNSWNREDRRQTIGPRGSRESENVMTRSDILLRPSADSMLPPPSRVSPIPPGAPAPSHDDVVVKKVKPLSQEEMEHKAKTILEEYLSVRDIEEVKLCLMELSGQQYLHSLVTACINEVLERSNKERDMTGALFHEMVKHERIPLDVYVKGLAEVLQLAEDFVIDIPMIWTYLAQIILPMIIKGSMPLSTLSAVLKPNLEGRCAAKLLSEILSLAREMIGDEEVALMWQDSDLSWTAFLPSEEVDRFVKDKKLEFTTGPVSRAPSRVPGPSLMDYEKVTDDIESIVQKNSPSSEIYAYIDARVRIDKQDRQFIRSLVTAMISASISRSTLKFNEDVIKHHKDVLQRYIKSNPELELQALYAIQALMHKLEHPSGVIANIFDVLYDEEIISEDTFKQWEKSTDPQELEGKGACSMQLTQFFAWLRENEEPETS